MDECWRASASWEERARVSRERLRPSLLADTTPLLELDSASTSPFGFGVWGFGVFAGGGVEGSGWGFESLGGEGSEIQIWDKVARSGIRVSCFGFGGLGFDLGFGLGVVQGF
jgi:hypothetical protein